MVTTRTRIKRRNKVRRVGSPDIIGIHTMEAPEGDQTAENVARYFDNVQADSHWCIDGDSRVRVIPDEFIAWTLPGANSRSLNMEFAGYARQSEKDWGDDYSMSMLEIGAMTAAEWCVKYDIPVRRLSASQIRNGAKGFAGHVDVNDVYHQSSHWDPGPHFPWEYFLNRVRVHVKKLGGKAPAPSPAPSKPKVDTVSVKADLALLRLNKGVVRHGDVGTVQTLLNLRGAGKGAGVGTLLVDKVGGQKTKLAVLHFQGKKKLTKDAVVGAKTWAALLEG